MQDQSNLDYINWKKIYIIFKILMQHTLVLIRMGCLMVKGLHILKMGLIIVVILC
jgi:hypothetical protein